MLIVKDTEMDNSFEMALLVGKRARDLGDGKPPIIEPAQKSHVTQAILETKAGVIKTKLTAEN